MPTASTSSSSNREMILTTKPPPTSTAVGYTGAARSSHFSQSAKQTVFKDMLGEKLWSYQTSAENSSNTSFLCGSGTVCCREQLCFATFTQRKRSCVRAAGLSTYTKPHFDRAVYVSRAAHCWCWEEKSSSEVLDREISSHPLDCPDVRDVCFLNPRLWEWKASNPHLTL